MLSPVPVGQYQSQNVQAPAPQQQAQQGAMSALQADPSTVRAAQGPEELRPEPKEPARPAPETGRGQQVDFSV